MKDYYTFKEQKRKIVLFHYPILEWEKIYSNAIHLYGHVHNTRSEYFNEVLGPRAVNAGACMLDYAPVSIQQIFQLVEGREKTLENTGK